MPLIRKDLPAPDVWPPRCDAEGVRAGLDYARRRDPVGHRVHVGLACLHLLCLPISQAVASGSFILLVGYTLLRLPNIWRCYPALLRVAALWGLLTFIVWHGISIAWSRDPLQGFDELRAARVFLVPFALWPVLDHLVWLIIAALVGIVCQNGTQLLQYLHLLGDPAEFKGRYRGLLHGPTAMWCLAAACWHLAAVLRMRGRFRWISFAGLIVACAGLIASGNRGPWIAAAITLPLAVIDIAWRRRESRRFAIVLVGVGILAFAATWPVSKKIILPRLETARNELRAAREDGVYWTSGGLRIGLWNWAIDAWTGSPIIGIGAGAYHDAIIANDDFQRAYREQQHVAPESEKMDRDHAHNTYLQTLATTGVIGLTLLATALFLVFRQVLRDPADHPYADGTLFVLIGWLLAANFDAYTLNTHLYSLLMFVVALTLPHRPPHPPDHAPASEPPPVPAEAHADD